MRHLTMHGEVEIAHALEDTHTFVNLTMYLSLPIGIPVKTSWPNGNSTFAAHAFSCHRPLNTVPKEPIPRISTFLVKILNFPTATESACVLDMNG